MNFERNGIDLAALLGLNDMMEEDDAPIQFHPMDDVDDDDDDDDVDIDEDVIIEESEMFRMNLHDTVVNTRGVNPLRSYIPDSDELTSSRFRTRPHNSSARH